MNNSKKILPLAIFYRQVTRKSSSNAYPVSSRYTKFLDKRGKLEVPDETPIHIKYGFGDKIMSQATWALAVVGTVLGLEVFYKVATGQKE